MDIRIISESISTDELKAIVEKQFIDLVKAVVDIEKTVMAVGGELHADEEALLLEHGSQQEHLWGINLYPAKEGNEFVEFDSMINLRPSQGNRSRGIEDSSIRRRVIAAVNNLVR